MGVSVASIEELEVRRDFLLDEVRDIEKQLHDLRQAAAPFKVGDIVVARRRRTRSWEDAQITDVKVLSWDDRYWYRVGWRRKDGTFGRQNERVFSDVKAKP